jgi:SAM-dependent methyltransferase
MPAQAILAELYGAEYAAAFPDTYQVDSPKNAGWVAAQLAARPRATFVDFGCGDGSLLSAAVEVGWKAYGVELDRDVAELTAVATGCPVLCGSQLECADPADVVHLGDVLEHLPDPASGLRQAVGLLAAGGTLLVQGPLEAGPSFFSSVVRPGRRRQDQALEMAPYHLIQATAQGQRQLFRRAGLVEQSYQVFEVDWPAPSWLSPADLSDRRAVALYLLRRISRGADHLLRLQSPHAARGNRFQYIGSLPPGWRVEG